MFGGGNNRGFLTGLLPEIILVLAVVSSIFPRRVLGEVKFDLIERLAEKWAPLVWLAPEEKYFPLAAEEFLEHVHPADKHGTIITASTLPVGRSSETLYLIPKQDLSSLKSNTSFLNGRNPLKTVVPVYVTVSQCSIKSCNRSNLYYSTCNGKNIMSVAKTRFHLTYWMFYPYNEGKEICYIGKIPAPLIFNRCLGKIKTLGNHIGDFEHVSISFDDNFVPGELFLAVHDIGVYYKYDSGSKIFKYSREKKGKGIMQKIEFPPVVRTFKGRPVLFAAKGSHGLWSAPGNYNYVRLPKLYDRNGYGTPWKTWKQVEVYHPGWRKPPVWMKYLGKWGSPKSNCFLFNKLGICELTDGPFGISRRGDDFKCHELQ